MGTRWDERRAAAGRKNGREKNTPGRGTLSLPLPAKESGEGDSIGHLPYRNFASLIHVLLAVPAKASHFSMATL